MTHPRLLVVAAFVLAAGCMGASNPGSVSNTPATSTSTVIPPAPSAAPTEEFGSIDVTVATDELAPVANAQIAIVQLDRSSVTDANGRATFNDLKPGDLTLVASKPGYSVQQEKGILTHVMAGEVAPVKFIMNPIQVVTAETSYHRTIPLHGFVACSVTVAPAVGAITYCGRGITVGGTTYLKDANENSTHTYNVEGPDIQTLHAEMTWQPGNSAFNTEFRVWNYASTQPCPSGTAPSTGPCYYGTFGGKGGQSPIRWSIAEGKDQNITASLAAEAKSLGATKPFPRTFGIFAEPIAYKPVADQNVGYSVAYQQKYEIWMSVFYGEPSPPGYTALPP